MKRTCLILSVGLGLSAGAAFAEAHMAGDAESGERVFRKCMACHAVGEGAQNKVGPMLNGVVGRPAGEVEGFNYSSALMEKATAEELVWTPENLDAFLAGPRQYIEGTKMAYPGLRKEEERADVIAYLATFSE